MPITLTKDVEKEVTDRLLYKAKNAKVSYLVAEALQDKNAMKIWQEEYDRAMNWLVAHNLA